MNQAESRDIGAYLAVRPALTPTASVAGAEAELTGITLDRLGTGNLFQSAVIIIHATDTGNTVADGDDLDITFRIEHSDDNFSTDTDYTPPGYSSAAIATDAQLFLGTAVYGTKAYAVDLSQAKRYVRIKVTPAFSAADTDTAVVSGFWVLGGPNEAPVDNLNP